MSSSPDPITSFLRGVRAFVRSLPSDEEKEELLRTLRSARLFLDEVQSLVEGLPTVESSKDLSHAMSRLDGLAARSRTSPGLARVLGMPKTPGTKVGGPHDDADVRARAEGLEGETRDLRRAEIVGVLERAGDRMVVLRALAARLGLPVGSGERKGVLIERIASHIENERGYRLLRGEAPESVSRPPKAKVS